MWTEKYEKNLSIYLFQQYEKNIYPKKRIKLCNISMVGLLINK